jgi:epoxyqueuosine reductase
VPIPETLPTIQDLQEVLAPFGVTHVGVTGADVLDEALQALIERREAGLHGGMAFTYRNPERSTDPHRAVAGARSVIAAARPYLTDDDPPAPQGSGPYARVGRYAWVDHYASLRAGLREAAGLLRRAGHKAVAYADDNAIVDRAVAERAGLGWYGRNANLLLPGAGSFFVLGCIVTTAVYEPAEHRVADACGTCRRCVEACPTDAIVGDAVIDGRRCLSWVLQRAGTIPEEFRVAAGDRIYGCDDCQDSCPISVRLGTRNTIGLAPTSMAWIDARLLLEADDQWILDRCGSWYIADRDVRWLRRNALVVIGNSGDPADRRLWSLLERYRAGDDDVLAEHADWAISRLGGRSGDIPQHTPSS